MDPVSVGVTYNIEMALPFETIKSLLEEIVSSAEEVYKELSWGWTEQTYQAALMQELKFRGVDCTEEVSMCVLYKGESLTKTNFRIDLLITPKACIGQKIIIELKADSGSKSVMQSAIQQCTRYTHMINNNPRAYPWTVVGCCVINFPNKPEQNVLSYSMIPEHGKLGGHLWKDTSVIVE